MLTRIVHNGSYSISDLSDGSNKQAASLGIHDRIISNGCILYKLFDNLYAKFFTKEL